MIAQSPLPLSRSPPLCCVPAGSSLYLRACVVRALSCLASSPTLSIRSDKEVLMRAFIWLQRQTRCCVKTRQCNGYAMTCTSGFMSSKYMLQCRWIYKTNHSTLSSILANNFSRYLGAYSKRASSSDSGTEERISAVDVNQFTTRWDAMFQQLKEYKSRHGDLLVPARYPENPSLGHFVDNNRQAYRMRQEYERHCADGDEKNPNSKWRKFIMMMTDEKIEGEVYFCY